MHHEEALKKIEPKENSEDQGGASGSGSLLPGRAKIKQLLEVRKQKLEKIKAYIPLKTYNSLREKLAAEQQQLEKKIESKEQQIKIDSRQQTLSKVFFEQKPLKIKAIRIN